MSWIKKAVGVAAVLGGAGLFACSGTNQVVGSDGRPVKAGRSAGGSNAGSGGHGPTIVSQAAPVSELSYEIVQVALSRRARDELRAGNLTAALATLEASQRRFSAPELYQEREALMIELLARSGQHAAAEQRGRAFLARFPESPHAQQIRQFIER